MLYYLKFCFFPLIASSYYAFFTSLAAFLRSTRSMSLDDVIWNILKQANSLDHEIRQMVIYTVPKLVASFLSSFTSQNEVNCYHLSLILIYIMQALLNY